MAFLEQKEQIYRFDDFIVNPKKRSLLRDNQPVSLNPKAFDLLIVLLENYGEIITKEELLNRVWHEQFVEEGNLTVHISSIRKALGETKNGRRLVVTVPGRGYQFVGDVFQTNNALIIEEHTISKITIEQAEVENSFDKLALPKKNGSNLKWVGVAGLAILAMAVIGWFWSRSPQIATNKTETTQTINSIAVLPFQFVNTESQNDGLELGLTESLINRLSSLKNISIRPISAVKKYTQENRDLAKIRDELKVDSVLEGYIQKVENHIRLTIRLLNTKNGLTIWNEQIDENLTDIFAVQDKIAIKITDSLQIILSDKEKSQLAKAYTENVDAYKKYLIGRHHWNKRTPESFTESIKFYKQAIDFDPTFALAYAGMADSYLLIGLYGIEPTTDAFPKARAAAEKALEIDKDLAEAEVDLAMIENLFQYDWKKAEVHFIHAIELKPSYSTGHHWFGLFLAMQGRTEEALQHLAKAIELDPLSPSISTDVAFAYYLANQNDKAIEQLNKTLKLEPDFPNAHNNLGMNYLYTKRFDEAKIEFEKANQLSNGNFGAIELIWANGFSGNKENAHQRLNTISKDKKISPFDMALIYTSFGEKEKAIEYLQQAYEKREPQLVPIKVYPPFETLRQEPKFNELLKKMNLS